MTHGKSSMGRALRTALSGAIGLLALMSGVQAAEKPEPLVLERTIPLEDVSGRIDHMALDAGRGRLIVAELGNGTVDVIDLAAGRPVHRIRGLKSPQGVGYAAGADVIAVAGADDGTVRLYRAQDFAPVGTVSLGSDADNIRLDGTTGHLAVGYGEGGIAVIDPAEAQVLSKIRLSAHPEGFQLDGRRGRAYVNLPDAHAIAVLDLTAGRQIASWPQGKLRGNFPMALAAEGDAIAVGFRDPARLVLLDPESGRTRAAAATCRDADDVFFDMRRGRLYVSCGEGVVDVFERREDALRRIARVPTGPGARTSLFIPDIDRLIVARRAVPLGGGAALLVYRPKPARR